MLAFFLCFSSGLLFAQTTQKKMESKAAQPEMKHDMKHECYMMKEHAVMHCTGNDATLQKTSVKLKNGSVLTADGKLTNEKGVSTLLKDGQCVMLSGEIGDYEAMHKEMKEIHNH